MRVGNLVYVALCIAAIAAAMLFNGQELHVLSLSLGALVAVVLACALTRPESLAPAFTVSFFLALLLAGWHALSILWSPAPYVSAAKSWWLAGLPLAFVAGAAAVPDSARRWLYAGLFALGMALVGLQLQQWLAGKAPRGTLLYKHSLAALLSLLLFAAVGQALLARRRLLVVVLFAAVAVLAFGIGLTAGRGVVLAALIGWAGFALLLRGSPVQGRLVLAFVTVAAGTLVANALAGGLLVDRMVTLADPASAGASRFVIWQGAWELAKTHFWLGTGAGTFWLAYPPVRLPADHSAAYYVHNDYLQMLVELGAVGLLLLLAWLGVLAAAGWRACSVQQPLPQRVEATALAAALLALCAHNMVDFNFHILPTLVVTGLFAGRLSALAAADNAPSRLATWFSCYAQRPAFQLISVLLAVLIGTHLAALGLGQLAYERSRVLAADGKLREADKLLARSIQFHPAQDAAYLARAELYLSLIDVPGLEVEHRARLYEQGQQFLTKAEKRNSLRPDVYYLRAKFAATTRELAGPRAQLFIEANLVRALTVDPWFHKARLAYGHELLPNDRQRAREVLEAGAELTYRHRDGLVGYYQLLLLLREQAGNTDGAREVGEKIKQLVAGDT